MDPKTAQEELAFIRKVIADSRRVAVDSGLDYIVWGLLVSAGMFATVALELLKVRGNTYLWLWITVMGGGWAFSLVRHLRENIKEKTKTLAGTILTYLWLSCGITIMTFIFVGGPFEQLNPSPVIAAVLAIGYLVSGVLLDFVYFKISAIFWWLGAVAMFYLNSPWARPKDLHFHVDLLLFGVMMVLFQVVPGIILYRRWRRELGDSDRA